MGCWAVIFGIFMAKRYHSISGRADYVHVWLIEIYGVSGFSGKILEHPLFVCVFDLFREGRHIYTFENRCIQNPGLGLGDHTAKIILNTKGALDDVTPELRRLLDFIDGKAPEDEFTRELDEAVQSARKNEKWTFG